MSVVLDYRHELGSDKATLARVSRVIWIEPDARKADIGFLEVARRTDGTRPEFITLAEQDARANSDVAVIGYPARAPAHIIPDQEWMEQIYGRQLRRSAHRPRAYARKQPRLGHSRLHDARRQLRLRCCSGMQTGKAVALHFAGLYMIENYAVPASTIRQYLKDRPWHGGGAGASDAHAGQQPGGGAGQVDHTAANQPPGQQVVTSGVEIRTDRGQVSVTIPLTITISLRGPQTSAAAGDTATRRGERRRGGAQH